MSDTIERKCSKPGCGALAITGKACLDRDCPQMWVHYTAYNAMKEENQFRVSDLYLIKERIETGQTEFALATINRLIDQMSAE